MYCRSHREIKHPHPVKCRAAYDLLWAMKCGKEHVLRQEEALSTSHALPFYHFGFYNNRQFSVEKFLH
jgi:hypothetical protein